MDRSLAIKIISFFTIFVLFALWELIGPRRPLKVSKTSRWITNLGIIVIGNGLTFLLSPIVPLAVSTIATERGWGILPLIPFPGAVRIVLGIVFLDFIMYLQHVLLHNLPLFWRFHKTHHTDLDLDVTSGLRFHPFEIILSLLIKDAAIILLGTSVESVFLFEILLNGSSMFNHSNIYVSPLIDKVLRLIVVTPDMHRVHHSILPQETDSNFGFNLPWWDRLLGTYRAQPSAGHERMTIGLSEYQDEKKTFLHWALIIPFLADPRIKKDGKNK